jgi:hypothetical protein
MIRPRHEGGRNGQRWKEGVTNDRKGVIYSRSKRIGNEGKKGSVNGAVGMKQEKEAKARG